MTTEDSILDGGRKPAFAGKIDVTALERLSYDENVSVFEALEVLGEIAAAFQCQPRFTGRDGFANAGGEVIEEVSTAIGKLKDACEDRFTSWSDLLAPPAKRTRFAGGRRVDQDR